MIAVYEHLPQPRITPAPDAAPFWEAARRHEWRLPYCRRCSGYFFYPRPHCPTCGSQEIEWRAASGRGRIYSFCIHYQSALPEFRDATPFVTVIVTLAEGPRLMGLLVDVPPDPAAIRCDTPVEVAFADGPEWSLPVFRPAPPGG